MADEGARQAMFDKKRIFVRSKRYMMTETKEKNLEVCFSPALFNTYEPGQKTVVLVDILRATSTICAALHHGVEQIIPVTGVEEARQFKEQGYIVAGERDGKVLDFADFGNSPYNFMNDQVIGKTIAYSTTNGTKAIKMAHGAAEVLIGSYLNHRVLANYLIAGQRDVIILCSGWKNKFSLEDSLFAGALAATLMNPGNFQSKCDSTHAAIDLWSCAKNDVIGYIQKAAHRERLQKLGLDDVIVYCHTFDLAPVLPVSNGTTIIKKDIT